MVGNGAVPGHSPQGVAGHCRVVFLGCRSSEAAGEEEASLLAGALGPAGQTLSTAQLVAATQFARLRKARVHMGAGQVFLDEIHLGSPVRGGDAGGQRFSLWMVMWSGLDGGRRSVMQLPHTCGAGLVAACGQRSPRTRSAVRPIPPRALGARALRRGTPR